MRIFVPDLSTHLFLLFFVIRIWLFEFAYCLFESVLCIIIFYSNSRLGDAYCVCLILTIRFFFLLSLPFLASFPCSFGFGVTSSSEVNSENTPDENSEAQNTRINVIYFFQRAHVLIRNRNSVELLEFGRGWFRIKSEMANDVNYQAMANKRANPFIEQSSHLNHEAHVIDETTDTENEDAHRDNSIMIHVVPDTSKGLHLKWFHSVYFASNAINIIDFVLSFSLSSICK